jgi:mono/diheme cytochrome c family protein
VARALPLTGLNDLFLVKIPAKTEDKKKHAQTTEKLQGILFKVVFVHCSTCHIA